jgi:DNA repair protein SbcC/Rad50
MKPLMLKLDCFGPFADQEIIDFSPTQTQNIFLMCGAIGSGKSIILDALGFALYGNPSKIQYNRTFEDLISHYKDPKKETCITFDFSVGQKAYQIERKPTQQVESKGKMVTRQTSAVLRDLGTGTVLAEGSTKVSDYVVDHLFGLDREQFFKVIVLQQGRFREFLEAKAADRQKLLRKVFGTERYQRVYEILNRRALDLDKKIKKIQNKIEGKCESAGVKTTDELKDKIAGQNERGQKHQEDLPIKVQAHEKAKKAHEGAKITAKKLAEFEEAQKRSHELTAQKEDIDTQRQALAQAERAAKLADKFSASVQRQKEKTEADTHQVQSETQVKATEAERVVAQEKAKEAESKKPELAKWGEQLEKLLGMEAPVKELHKSQAALLEVSAELAKTESAIPALESQRKTHKEKCSQLEDQRREAGEAAAQLQGSQQKLESCRRRVQQHKDLVHTQGQLENQTEQEQANAQKIKDKSQELKANQDAHQELVLARQKNLAAELAHILEDGHACPVCGSEDHPKKAEHSEEAPTKEQLDDALAAIAKAQDALESCRAKHSETQQAIAKLKGKSEELRKAFADDAEVSEQVLQDALNGAQAEHEKASGAAGQLARLDADLLKAKGEDERLEKESKALLLKQTEQKTKSAELSQRVEELQSQIPAELQVENALPSQVTSLREKIERQKKALEDAQRGLREVQNTLAAHQASLEAAEASAKQAQDAANKAQDAFAAGLKEADFADQAAYEACQESPETMAQMKTRVESYDKDVAIAVDRLKRAQEDAKDLEKPDLALLAGQEKAAKAAETALRDAITTLETQLKQDNETLKQIEESAHEEASLSASHKKVDTVAKTLKGKKGENQFEAFVLGYLFEAVLRSASHRLFQMSNGRYQLSRADKIRGGQVGHSGLEVVLNDSFSGKPRASVTFSGGEGFLASLSLALGLADVAVAEAGGRSLDCVFIDEGFGTLEPEDVNRVINVLTDSGKNNRLVGLVSHVETVRTLVPLKLEFTKTGPGISSAAWIP